MKSVKTSPSWINSQSDAVNRRNYHLQIGKKCGNIVDAFVGSKNCSNKTSKDLVVPDEIRAG